MNRFKCLSLALSSILIIGAWLFFGVEETPREHHTEYEFFAKQEPTFQVVFRNPAVCGECDTPPLSLLSAAQKADFARFCRVRYGLDEIRMCHAIYAEWQRMADESNKR